MKRSCFLVCFCLLALAGCHRARVPDIRYGTGMPPGQPPAGDAQGNERAPAQLEAIAAGRAHWQFQPGE